MVTIKDIANALGISHSTVSRALNGSRRVLPETRTKVEEMASKLGYVANAAAREMKQVTKPVVGVIAHNLGLMGYGSSMLGTIDKALRENGYLALFTHISDRDAFDGDLHVFKERRVSGLIYVSLDPHPVKNLDIFDNIPTVFINCYEESQNYSSVLPDNLQGMRDIVIAVLEKGYRSPVFLNIDGRYPASELRRQGLTDAFKLRGLNLGRNRYFELPISGPVLQDELVGALQAEIDSEKGVDLIICGRDETALEVTCWLLREGYKVPEDIAVCGFDDQSIISQHMLPRLTTVALPYEEMARWGVNKLIKSPTVVKKVLHPCELIIREST